MGGFHVLNESLQLLAAGTDIEIAVLIISEVGPGELALRCDLALVPDWDVGIDVAIDQPSLSKDLFNKLSHKQKYRGIEIRLFRLPQSTQTSLGIAISAAINPIFRVPP